MNFEISREEIKALLFELQHNFVRSDNQRLVYDVVRRMEAELEKEEKRGS